MVSLNNRPRWVELITSDPAAANKFYEQLFGWQVGVSDDPQYGGYGMGMVGDKPAAGIGGKQDPSQPTAWSLYIGADDLNDQAQKVKDAGGTVIAEPFDVGDQGQIAVYRDPSGGFISGWKSGQMDSWIWDQPNTFGWAELNARGVKDVIPFYQQVFGWDTRESDMGADQPPYTEFRKDDESILGAWEMNPMVPAEVPTYWQIYFNVADVDAAFEKAKSLGATEMVAPQDFPGGRFAIVSDPQGASFGLLRTAQEG
jgi:predicted enzyme related to lactoylglutathione lyase